MPLPIPLSRLTNLMPLFALEALAGRAVATVLDRHPRLLERMGEHGSRTLAFSPTDLALVFLVTPRSGRITVLRGGSRPAADARIAGPLVVLLALLEGRIDGDATFFSRDISVEGDMEAIVAIRNALDDAAIDLPTDLAPRSGPLRRPVELGLRRVRQGLLAGEGLRWN